MYVKNMNSKGYAKSIFMVAAAEGGCCDESGKLILGKYKAKLDTGTIATIDRVTIDGVLYNFVTVRSTTTSAGQAGINSEINEIVRTLLGTHQGNVAFSLTGTTFRIVTDFSQLKFESIGNGSATVKFAPIETLQIGSKDSGSANFSIKVVPNGANYDITIRPFAGKTISNVTVNYNGSTAEYNAAWPKPSSYTLPVGTTIVEGGIRFSVVNATAEAAATLAVSITPTDESAVAYSQSVILADFKL